MIRSDLDGTPSPSGNAGLTRRGLGQLTLTKASTFTGPTVVTSGAIAVGAFEQTTTFSVQLNGPEPGIGPGHHEQLIVGGPVALAGAILTTQIGYIPQPGDS